MTNHYFISSADPRTIFYLTTFPADTFSFDSSYFPGMCLLMEDGVLKAGTPNNGNDKFQSVSLGTGPEVSYRQGDCFIAFNWNGEPITSPCNITQLYPATPVAIVPV